MPLDAICLSALTAELREKLEGAKPRQVLIDRAGWHDIQVQLGLASDDDLSLAAEMNDENDY